MNKIFSDVRRFISRLTVAFKKRPRKVVGLRNSFSTKIINTI